VASIPFDFAGRLAFLCFIELCNAMTLCENFSHVLLVSLNLLGVALVAEAREDSPVSDALLSIHEKRDACLSSSRFST
jgi:hypothetical protein